MNKYKVIVLTVICLGFTACSEEERKFDVEVDGAVLIKAEEELKQKYEDQEEADLKKLEELRKQQEEMERVFQEKKKQKEAERLLKESN